uniref:Ceroid-lipofuscinosis neuronal protein 6 n=1 Tax=Magallana gigas TaxID=29159 RepID=K1PQZ6_MAGGI
MDTRHVRRRGRGEDLEELMIDDFRDMKPARSVEGFHWDIWLLMTLQNWIFDFGRPIAALFERSHTKTSSTFRNICVIIFVMGASIHLVGDSVNHRLVKLGYKLHLSVRDNPMMQSLQPRGLVWKLQNQVLVLKLT